MELGIDIGAVKSVAQIGPPPSVAALRQRLGRSGRRPGEVAILRAYATEHKITADSPLSDRLREGLLQTAASVRLLIEKWCEPPRTGGMHLSTLVQQVLSMIAERGGVSAAEVSQTLIVGGPFAGLTPAHLKALLRELARRELVVQDSSGALLLGPLGERIVGSYDFYAAFTSGEEWEIVQDGRGLGTLPIDSPVYEGQCIIFGGRRWKILSVSTDPAVLLVAPDPSGRPPQFDSGRAMVHERIHLEMRRVLEEDTELVFLDVVAQGLLREARRDVYKRQVLFRLEGDDGVAGHHNAAGYEASAVMLDLAITLANADGKISGREVQFLNRQVDAWAHVGDSAQRRLRARLRLGIVYPPSLASLRSKIEPLPAEAKVGLGKLLSALALADGTLAPAAVKHLEKVYGLLGIEASALYRELHVASAASDRQARGVTASRLVERSAPEPVKGLSATVPSLHVPKRAQALGGFQLDPARVAALQVESERVTAMLSKVFEDQESMASVATVPLPSPALDDTEAESHGRESRLLGLDPEHSAFLRVLLTRPSWSRAELGEVAADMELMLDGALERVNEATLDTLDNRIAEGDDQMCIRDRYNCRCV